MIAVVKILSIASLAASSILYVFFLLKMKYRDVNKWFAAAAPALLLGSGLSVGYLFFIHEQGQPVLFSLIYLLVILMGALHAGLIMFVVTKYTSRQKNKK